LVGIWLREESREDVADLAQQHGVCWPLTITTRAPAAFARGTTFAAGNTDNVEPTANNRSHSSAARIAASITSGTSDWPNETVSLFKIPSLPFSAQTRQCGSSSPAPTRSNVSTIGRRSSQVQQRLHRIVPCTSMTFPGACPVC
jgi:hypothetical protein